MVATFEITYDNLGVDNNPGASSPVTNLRFNAADNNNQDLNSPLNIPTTGTIYSYWKQIYLKCTVAPDSQVNNVKVFSDGTLDWGTGVTVQVGDGTQVKNSVSSAGYNVANAQEIMTNHTDVTTETPLFNYTSGSPRDVSISEAGGIIVAINQTTDYLVLQVNVDSNATPGLKTQETITYQYDEI